MILPDFMNHCATFFCISRSHITATTRDARSADQRAVIVWCLREHYRLSYPRIGEIMCRDHSSMIHAVRRVNNNFELLFTARQLLDSAGLTRKQLKIESTQRYKSTIAVETYGIEPENVLKVAMCMEGVNYA